MPTDETKLALLEQNMGYLVKGFDSFTAKFEEWQNKMSNEYVPRSELELEFRNIKEEIKGIKEDRNQSRSITIAWSSVGIAAISTIVAIVALIRHF